MALTSLHDVPGSHLSPGWEIPAVASAGVADEDHPIFRAPFKCKAIKVHLVPQASLSGQATNNRSLVVQFRGADGTTSTAIGSTTLASGTNLAVMDVTTIDITDQNMSADDVLALANELNGTGLATPRMVCITEYEGR